MDLARAVLAVGVFAAAASAQSFQGNMCKQFKTGAIGCGSGGFEASHYDDVVAINATQVKTPLHKLVVFFHGHGASTGPTATQSDFLGVAAQQGYDTLEIDYPYGRDYTNVANGDPHHCQHPDGNTCVAGGRDVCGCYSDCYAQRWESIWRGTPHAGLPPVTADWTVDTRLKATIEWVKNKKQVARFGEYLDAKQLDGINWSRITLAAHSMGTNLAGYIAKHQAVDRVALLSGTCDKLAPDVASQFYATPPSTTPWAKGYGCGGCVGTDENGQPYTFSGCTCGDTTFGYGAANGGKACTLTTKAVGWTYDNPATGGAAWKTDIKRFYAFADSDDHVCTWDAPKAIAIQRNWKTLGLDKLHDAGVGDGWALVGDCASPPGPLPAGNYHGLLSTGPKGADSQICNGTLLTQCASPGSVSGHNATVAASACQGSAASADKRKAIWVYMLTNP